MTPDHTAMLRALDPAPDRALTADEENQREQLLHQVLTAGDSLPRAAGTRRPGFRLTIAIGAGLAFALAATVVAGPPILRAITGSGGASTLTATDVASWTNTALLLAPGAQHSSPAQERCLDDGVGDPEKIEQRKAVYTDLRGRVVTMVFNGDGEYSLCMAGADGGGFAELLDPPAPLPARDVRSISGGGHGNGAAAFDYSVGRAGEEVVHVMLLIDGKPVDTQLADGWWSAWWPATDGHEGPPTVPNIRVTTTLRDGTTHTGPLTSIYD